jgi:hypothetical protein
MFVNGLGIPSQSGAEVPSHPESMQHPVWKGFGWVSDETAYARQVEHETRQAALQNREMAKVARAAAVASIIVTTSSGKAFDGHEDAQARMSRAILGMQATNLPMMPWTLADNTIAYVTIQELTEALILAGTRQSELWNLEQYL